MSVKAMGLVWDLECPKIINETEFKPTHKFVLMAYADHADHHGKNIWPSVHTIAEKTGLDERTVQRLTRDLETTGLMVDDGQGPRGTRRWKLPYNGEGWQFVTPDKLTGDKSKKSLGDIPSGDIPSGGNLSPELKEPEPNQFNISIHQYSIWGDAKKKLQDEMPRAEFDTWVRDSFAVHFDADQNTLWVATRNDYAKKWMASRLTSRAQEITGLYVGFMVIHEISEYVNEFEDVAK